MKFNLTIKGDLDTGEIIIRTPFEVEVEIDDDPKTPEEKPEEIKETKLRAIGKAVNG